MNQQYVLVTEYVDRSIPSRVLTTVTAGQYTSNEQCNLHTVVENAHYLREAKAIKLSDADLDMIVTYMAAHPQDGEVIRGSGGAHKIRFPGKGKGKLGGLRVFSFYSGKDIPVFLLRIITKNEKENLTAAELNELRAEVEGIVKGYRERN